MSEERQKFQGSILLFVRGQDLNYRNSQWLNFKPQNAQKFLP